MLQGMLVGVLCAALVQAPTRLGWLHGLEVTAWNALFLARGARRAASPIVILTINDETVARGGRALLPRSFYARAVRLLHRAGARTIAFNLRMTNPTQTADDQAIVNACRESGRVVQAVTFGASSTTTTLSPRFAVTDIGGHFNFQHQVVTSLPELMESAPAAGHLNLNPEADGTFRRVPHLIRFRDKLYPSLALATAAHFLGLRPRDVVAAPRELRLAAPPVHLSANDSPASDSPASDSPEGRLRRVPLDRRGEAWINWLGGERSFPKFPLHRLLDDQVPASHLKGSIVLIGFTTTGSFQAVATPFSPVLSSMDLQANAVDDILANRALREMPVAGHWWLLFGFAMLAGALVAPRGALGGVLWMLALGAALWGAALFAMIRHDFYIPVAPALVAALLACVSCVGYREVRAARELKLVKGVFSGYVGDEVLEQLGGRLPKMGGEIRHVAVLFCDIQGFSALSERLRDDPEKLLGLLNAHFEPLVQCLKSHGAYVDNYLGDLVMAVFGAPVSAGSPDTDTRNAVLAALDFARIVEKRNAVWRAQGQAPIEVGIGVHAGPAVVGNIGSKQRMHYTAIGDTVNIGSRVESSTRKYNTPLLVTEEVVNACRNHTDMASLEWELADETQVKGRVTPVRLYRCKSLMASTPVPSESKNAAP